MRSFSPEARTKVRQGITEVLTGIAHAHGLEVEIDHVDGYPATINDDQAAIRADWTVDAVVTELRDAARRVTDRAGRVPDELWTRVGTIPWYGAQYAIDDLLVYQMYGHKREHGPQLEAVLDRPGRG